MIRTSLNERRLPGKYRVLLGWIGVLGGISAAVEAQPTASSPVSGSVSMGTRSVDLTGSVEKYREDVNLDDGVRLFDAQFYYRPVEDINAVDEIQLSMRSLGGDPFESIHLGVRKYGSYRLRLDRRTSDYFYQDTILPAALASVSASTGGDFHHFDFERVRDTAALDITLTPATRINFGLERQTRSGESTTTLDIERDEFEFDRPLDESLDAFNFGVEHDFERVTLIFEEALSDFENTSEIFLPGASPGQNLTDPAELQFFFLDQSYDYRSRSHLLRALADPTDRIHVAALWRREDLELDSIASEQALGTTYTGAPLATDLSGPGRASRDHETLGVDLNYALGDRARIVAGVRSNTLEQLSLQSLGSDQGRGQWRIETDGVEIGGEISLGLNTVVAAGWSTESRDTSQLQLSEDELHAEFSSTDRDGYFARLLHRTNGGIELTAAIEDNSIDDPFSLASPTDGRRYKLTARYDWEFGLRLQGDYRRTDVDNAVSGWSADTEQSDLRLRYTRSGLLLTAAYTRIEVEREIAQLVTGGSLQVLFPIAYAADASMRDLSARWAVGERIAFGGSLRRYDNRGSFRIDRDDSRAFIEYAMTGDYTLDVSYRRIDYAEAAFDAYDASILELAIRLDW